MNPLLEEMRKPLPSMEKMLELGDILNQSLKDFEQARDRFAFPVRFIAGTSPSHVHMSDADWNEAMTTPIN